MTTDLRRGTTADFSAVHRTEVGNRSRKLSWWAL